MSGYVKKIAVIKQLKGGFSADGGLISGLVKAETYAGYLKAEVSLINLAPLSEGRYVFGISDGKKFIVFEDVAFECEADFDLSEGFAFMVCFCHGATSPVASAYCGRAAAILPLLKEEIASKESVKQKKSSGAAYDDEAITEINYYERQTDKGCEPVCEDKEEEQKRDGGCQDEENIRAVQVEAERVDGDSPDERDLADGLSGGDFYSRMSGDIERIFASYPREEGLENTIEGSRFVKIAYAKDRYYVFGVLSIEREPVYICYGVPSSDPTTPPISFRGCSSYVPCNGNGYWMTYQDAKTGISIKIDVV